MVTNQIQLIGFVGSNPEFKTVVGVTEKKLFRFSLAINERYKNEKGETVSSTMWVNLAAWNKTAERAQELIKKGTHLAISGKLSIREYMDKEGNKRHNTEVVVDEFLLLDRKADSNDTPQN